MNLTSIPDVQLSKREREALNLVLQGKGNEQIALALDISVRTVEFHLKNVYAKFQMSSRIELLLKLGPATGAAKINELGIPQLKSGGKTRKIEAGSIRKWIGLRFEGLSLSSVRS